MKRPLPQLVALVGLHVGTAEACQPAKQGEPTQVYLLTTSPGGELFSKFGHSALAVSGGSLRRDTTFSWGAYDSSKEEPVSAFLDGRMHYWLDLSNWAGVERRAATSGRILVAQRLDLPPAALARLSDLLRVASRPENHSYEYNWRDQNCATRIRDLLDEALEGELRTSLAGPTDRTWRKEILRHLEVQPLAWFGWTFMAGATADEPLDRWQGMFLPDRLRDSLAEALIGGRPLVSETCEITSGPNGWAPELAPRGWPCTLALGLGWGAVIAKAGRRVAGAGVAALGLVAGALGAITCWLAATSAIDGVGYNQNWAYANPVTLALLPAGAAVAIGTATGRKSVAGLAIGLAVAGVAGVVFALSPWGSQDTAATAALFVPPLLATAWRAGRDRIRD